MDHLKHIIATPKTTIAEGQKILMQTTDGIILICDKGKLLGVVTDGDYRRKMGDVSMSDTLMSIAVKNNLIVGHAGISDVDAFNMMMGATSFMLLHLPIVNDKGELVDLKTVRQIRHNNRLPVRALIMAGGFGKRLGDLTENMPKPMLKVGGKPMLEIIIEQFKRVGVTEIFISIHYLPEIIEDYFETGMKWGVKITFVREDNPLGTAGCLSLLPSSIKPTVVINGDILTTLNLTSFVEYHLQHKAKITVASRVYDMQVPYGVMRANENNEIKFLEEKPVQRFFVNSGIYVISPDIQESIPKNTRIDMTDVIEDCIQGDDIVKSFIMHEDWLDIGRPEDFEKAEDYFKLQGIGG